MRKQKACLSTRQGSALVFALIMLSIMVIIAVGSYSASVIGHKTSNDTTKSVSAFQAADTGIEKVFKKINEEITTGGAVKTLRVAGLCTPGFEYYQDNTALADRKITVTFYSTGGLVTNCAATKIEELVSIKAVGEFGGTVRAVSVDVKNPGCGGTTTRDGITYGKVLAADGRCWLDMNLGATRVATVRNDNQAYGWYFQWGRGVDGHQLKTSLNTTSTSSTNTPPASIRNRFIVVSAFPNDWRSPQFNILWQGVSDANNPCPAGFRIPTKSEWERVVADEGISNNDSAFASSLKLPSAASRSHINGAVVPGGSEGGYWSSTRSGTNANYFYFSAGINLANTTPRAEGLSVRCIKD